MNSINARNIALIGMPGAGKSTVGVILAKTLGLNFVDTDLLIQEAEQATLQEIIDRSDYLHLRKIEEEVLTSNQFVHTVVSTGGSVVYSEAIMRHLGANSDIIYLQLPFAVVSERINNLSSRGIARSAEQSLEDVFHERVPLYEHYAQYTIPAYDKPIEAVVEDIISTLGR